MNGNEPNQTGRSASTAQLRRCRDVYCFSGFRFDRGTAMLTSSDKRVQLAPKATQLLVMLLDNSPWLVSRDELRAELWSDSTFIEFEGALNTCVRQVRAALGDSAGDSHFIETVPKRGYRFVAELEPDPSAPALHGRKTAALFVTVAVVAVLAALIFPGTNNALPPELLVVLPVEGDATHSLDPTAGYGIAMIASEQIARLHPDKLAVINSRSLRELVANEGDLGQLKSPDYVVRTRILGRGDAYLLDAELRRYSDGEILSAHKEPLDGDMATVLRESPEIIVAWLSGALDLHDDSGRTALVQSSQPVWDSNLVAAFWHLEGDTLADTRMAVEGFEKTLVVNPKHVWALEGKLTSLADLSMWRRGTGAADRAFANMEETAQFMFDNNIYSGKSFWGMGFVQLYRDWDLSKASNSIEAALLITPQDARAHNLYAAVQAASGNTGGAVRSAEVAERLDPAAMAVRSDRCWYLVLHRDFRQAVDVCESALELNPRHTATRIALAQARFELGEEQAALQIIIDIIRRTDETAFDNFKAVPATWQELGCLRANEILVRNVATGVLHYLLAKYYSQCGRQAEAIAELKLAVEQREPPALFLRSAPEFDTLRDVPEFKKLQQMLL